MQNLPFTADFLFQKTLNSKKKYATGECNRMEICRYRL